MFLNWHSGREAGLWHGIYTQVHHMCFRQTCSWRCKYQATVDWFSAIVLHLLPSQNITISCGHEYINSVSRQIYSTPLQVIIFKQKYTWGLFKIFFILSSIVKASTNMNCVFLLHSQSSNLIGIVIWYKVKKYEDDERGQLLFIDPFLLLLLAAEIIQFYPWINVRAWSLNIFQILLSAWHNKHD